MQNNYSVSVGMDHYEALSLLIWYDILTEEFLLYFNDYFARDLSLSDPDVNEFLLEQFKHYMWIKGEDSGYLSNNGKFFEWEKTDTQIKYIRIGKMLNGVKVTLVRLDSEEDYYEII